MFIPSHIFSKFYIARASIHGSAFDPDEDSNDNSDESMCARPPLSNSISQHLQTCWDSLMAIVAKSSWTKIETLHV